MCVYIYYILYMCVCVCAYMRKCILIKTATEIFLENIYCFLPQ